MFVVDNLFEGKTKVYIFLLIGWSITFSRGKSCAWLAYQYFGLCLTLTSQTYYYFMTKEILTLTMNRYLILISVDFYTTLFLHFRFSSSFYWDDLSNTWHSSSKVLCYVSYFQRFSRCLWNVVKHGVSCLIYFLTSDERNKTSYSTYFIWCSRFMAQ